MLFSYHNLGENLVPHLSYPFRQLVKRPGHLSGLQWFMRAVCNLQVSTKSLFCPLWCFKSY